MSNRPNVAQQQQQMRAHAEDAQIRDEIQDRAYYRYLARGRADGQALDDWLGAEEEVRETTKAPSES